MNVTMCDVAVGVAVRVRKEDVSDMAPKSEEGKDLNSFAFIRKMVVGRIIVHDERISKQNGAIHFMCAVSLLFCCPC